MTKRSLRFFLAGCLVLSISITSQGWGAGGHMMVASIAFKRLNPKAKAQVKKLLAIPINPCDVTKQSPDFVNAAHWADDVRPRPGFEFAPNLHFINFPFVTDNTPRPDLPQPQNIIEALKHYVGVLQNSFDTNEQAQALRFVIHFVGDIHQPLHCSTKVDSANPTGDQGGNLFILKIGTQTVKLHSYWDGGLGSFPKGGPAPDFAPPALSKIGPAVTTALQGHPDTDPELKLDDPFDYQQWAKESEKLAKDAAYKDVTAGKAPSTAYKARGIEIVRKRVAFAGYRLAALLNKIWPDAN